MAAVQTPASITAEVFGKTLPSTTITLRKLTE